MPSSISSPLMPGLMLALMSRSFMAPSSSVSMRVARTSTWPLAVLAMCGRPAFKRSLVARLAGTTTAVAPVSSIKVTGMPLMRPLAT